MARAPQRRAGAYNAAKRASEREAQGLLPEAWLGQRAVKTSTMWAGSSSDGSGTKRHQAPASAPAPASALGKPVTSRVAVDKLVDRTSSQLFVAATQGKAFTSAVIEIADEDTGIPRFRLSLTGVVLEYSGASGPSPGGAGQIESFVLDFANAQYNYNPVPEADAVDLLQAIFKNLGLAAVNDPRASAAGRGGTGVGKRGFSEIVVSKPVDVSSTHLFGATREPTSGRPRNSRSSGSP
jgi:type VI protein secretion system component Hcp